MSEVQNGEIIQIPQGEAGATILQVLQANIGMEVSVDYVIGGSCVSTQGGTLYAATAQYIALYDAESGAYALSPLNSAQTIRFLPGGAQTPAAEAPQANTTSGVQPVNGGYRAQAHAAFNYAKRKSQRIE